MTRRRNRRPSLHGFIEAVRSLIEAFRLALKLMFVYSWRGACRGVRDFARWVYDYDSASLKHHHAGKLETKEYHQAHADRRATLRAHALVTMAIGLPTLFPILAWIAPVWLAWITAFVLFCWIVKLIPGKDISEFFIAATIAGLVGWLLPGYLEMIPVPPVWVFVVVGVPVLVYLGYLGRPMDRPVLKGTVAAATEPPLGAPMVIRALTSLGNSKMSPKTQMDPATQITLWTDLHREGPGVIGDFVLPEGVPASFVVGKREEFAAALRRPLGCCWPSVGDKHPGHLVVFITRKPMSQAEQDPWPLLKRGEVNIFNSFPAFTDQKNQWVGLTLAYSSMIIGAVPRMGKTFVVRELLLASGLDKRVRVAAIDGKGTGDLSACALYADFYSRGDREEELHRVRDYLRGLKREVQRRADVIDGLTREEAPESKVDDRLASKRSLHLEPIVVGIDETQTYFEEAPEKLRNEFVELVTYLVKKGPALGVIVILATQQVTAKTIPTSISNNAVIRFCMKVEGGFQPNDQILGTGAYSRGVDANMLDIDDKGIGYLKAEGTKPRIVRSVWGLDAVASEKIALRARQLRVDAGLLVGQAAGEELEREADQVNLLAELRDIFGASTQKMTLAGIGAALADRFPGVYGELTNSTTAALLRDLGLEPVPVRVDGVVEKGLKREQVFEAVATEKIGPDEDGDGVVVPLPRARRDVTEPAEA